MYKTSNQIFAIFQSFTFLVLIYPLHALPYSSTALNTFTSTFMSTFTNTSSKASPGGTRKRPRIFWMPVTAEVFVNVFVKVCVDIFVKMCETYVWYDKNDKYNIYLYIYSHMYIYIYTRILCPPKAGHTNRHKTLIILKSNFLKNMDF